MEIIQGDKGIKIHQAAYIKKLLERFGMQDCKPVSTPGVSQLKLENDLNASSSVPYRELVGALMFLTSISRPDIAFEVSRAAQFMSAFGEQHWLAAKRILRYLRGTMHEGISYTNDGLELQAFADAEYASNVESRKSTSGFVLTLAGGPITWASRAQKTVAQSTTEAEYVALAECVKDVLWAQQMLRDIETTFEKPTKVHSDNQGAIKFVKNPIYHRRTKHIDVRHHFIRDEREKNNIEILFVPTDCQPADMLTKSLCYPSLKRCKDKLKIVEINSQGEC